MLKRIILWAFWITVFVSFVIRVHYNDNNKTKAITSGTTPLKNKAESDTVATRRRTNCNDSSISRSVKHNVSCQGDYYWYSTSLEICTCFVHLLWFDTWILQCNRVSCVCGALTYRYVLSPNITYFSYKRRIYNIEKDRSKIKMFPMHYLQHINLNNFETIRVLGPVHVTHVVLYGFKSSLPPPPPPRRAAYLRQ